MPISPKKSPDFIVVSILPVSLKEKEKEKKKKQIEKAIN